ncbi:flagellar filament capping protein FliD [Desulfobacter postgatei]|jgi:flagellar hook-associated protein 2|uniref:flagellar filament capping protein FliD n=1 Tax=Desulfobacter postgatei TaxID=2293 RepID=UPI002A3594D9|nr:flagellar filament capping protein FliD [Desulfobacter postgatei]MDX9964133.1 flagellar filament capping protein FliD [Desulfobacter postgatei]
MGSGSITSLGVGSGLELQDILDQLRQADEVSIDIKEAKKTKLEAQVVEFDSINAKLIQLKSSALSLSLKSNFQERTAEMSDEEVATASVISGTKQSSYALDVQRLATKSSWQSIGVEEESSFMYAAPGTGIASSDTPAVSEATPLSFTIGHGDDQKSITLDIEAGSSLKDIADAINMSAGNLSDDGTTYVTATVETGSDGNYIRLASTDDNSFNNNQILVSEGPDFLVPDLMFSYQTGSASDPVYVSVPPGTSYQDTVSLINDDTNNSGVTAALINDGSADTPWHLILTADTEGENNRIFLNGINMTEMQGAEGASLNAAFSVDGYGYQRQTNKGLEDVIQGVTLNFDKIGETQLTISSDADNIKEKITQLIDGYNELIAEIAAKTQYDEDEEEDGVLSDVYAIKSLGSNLLSFMTNEVDTGGGITSLLDLGMELNGDGSITLDETALDAAFSSSFEDVVSLFIGDSDNGITGLGDILNDKLAEMTRSTGVVNGEKTAAEEKIDRLTTSIETATERLDKRYEVMAQQFVRLDALIGTMNSQSEYLTSMFDSFNNSQEK